MNKYIIKSSFVKNFVKKISNDIFNHNNFLSEISHEGLKKYTLEVVIVLIRKFVIKMLCILIERT